MAKYCSNCGRKLNEGETCNCKLNNNSFDIKRCFGKALELFKGMFTKPVDAMKNFIKEENFALANVIIVIIGIISGLFAMLLTKETMGNLYGGLSSLMSGAYFEIPYFKIFIITTILVIGVYYLQALILYLVAGKIFKAEVGYKGSFNLLTSLAIFSLTGILVSIIGVLISPVIVVLVIALVSLFTITNFVLGVKEVIGLNDSKSVYTIVLTSVILSIVLYVISLIFS